MAYNIVDALNGITGKGAGNITEAVEALNALISDMKEDVTNIKGIEFHVCTSSEVDSSTGLPVIAEPNDTTVYLVSGTNEKWIYAAYDRDSAGKFIKNQAFNENSEGIRILPSSSFDPSTGEPTITGISPGILVINKDTCEVWMCDMQGAWSKSSDFYFCKENEVDKTSGVPIGDQIDPEVSAYVYVVLNKYMPKDPNLFNEYIYVNNGFEKIGYVLGPVPTRIKDDPTENGGVLECKASTASGEDSHAEGAYTTASGYSSHAEGTATTASGSSSHTEGDNTVASDEAAHAEGNSTTASGYSSHAEGSHTSATETNSHAEGADTTASGYSSHAEGVTTTASGSSSHAEGADTTASGYYSHAASYNTIAQGESQTVIGEYNVAQGTADSRVNTDYAFIIGNGTSSNARSNGFAIKWDGTLVFANGTEISPAQFASLLALLS